jgi:hypothetical protein
MRNPNGHGTDAGLDAIAARLRAERPQLSGLELDALQQRVRTRALRPAKEGGSFMRSRLAVLLMLVAGMLFSTTGAGLAVTGLASNDQASIAQYGEDDQGGDTVAGAQGTAGGTVDTASQTEFTGGGGQLPFTGFAALPLLVLGVALLGGGLLMRRRVPS